MRYGGRPELYAFLMHAFDVNNVNEPGAMSIRFGQMSEKASLSSGWFAF